MSRRRDKPRKWRPFAISYANQKLRSQALLRRTRGMRFSGANKGRVLSEHERRAVEDQMREQGTL